MDQSQRIILNPFNLFEWKDEMEILLREKGLYRVTMATKVEPNAVAEKIKWHNRRDDAYGLLNSLTSPNEVWEKLEDIFGKTDDMRAH